MDEEKARKILEGDITAAGDLYNLGWYLAYVAGEEDAKLDGSFTVDDLEAIAWWMRHSQGKEVKP